MILETKQFSVLSVMQRLAVASVLLICSSAMADLPTPLDQALNMSSQKRIPIPKRTSAVVLDRIAAVVNDSVITQSDVDGFLRLVEANLVTIETRLPQEKRARNKAALQWLIDESLELQLAKKMGIKIDAARLQDVVGDIAKRNKISVDELKASVATKGVEFDVYKQRLQDEMTISMLSQRVLSAKARVSKEEVNQHMAVEKNKPNEFHLFDYLIAVPDSATPAQKKIAKQNAMRLLDDLKAKKAVVNGKTDLGWRKHGEMPAAFEQRMHAMKQGDYAGPIRMGNGFHVIALVGVRHTASALDVNAVTELLFKRRLVKARVDWLKELRGQSYIKLMHE